MTGSSPAPRVSVVMCVYNGERFLAEALGSILGQSFGDLELVIVDDGSSDGTPAILADVRDPRLRVATLPANCGIATARNLGMAMARGEYVAVHDADDVAMPDRITAQVRFLDAHPEVHFLASGFIKDDEGRRVMQRIVADDAEIKARLLALDGTAMIHTTTMMRGDFLRANRLRYPARNTDVDHGLWIDAMAAGARFHRTDEVLVMFRRHGGNITAETSPWYPHHESGKTGLRARVLGLFHPDLSHVEAHAIARMLEWGASLTIAEIGLGIAACEKLLRLGAPACGASAELTQGLVRGAMARRMAELARHLK